MGRHEIPQTIKIKDTFGIVKKAASPLKPLIEGISHSLDSIKQRQQGEDNNFVPTIVASLFFSEQKDIVNETTINFYALSIEDNGIGFIEENKERLFKLADTSKNLNNRGTGKIQFFRRFHKVEIDSTMRKSENWE